MPNLAAILSAASAEISNCNSTSELEQLRVKYLGKKGQITSVLKSLKDLDPQERKQVGKDANIAKNKIDNLIQDKREGLAKSGSAKKPDFDYTLPGKIYPHGKLHPITQTFNELIDIFFGMGFEIAVGPEVESEHYNFNTLNFPKDHPARDMQDTFYISDDVLLRTHTSPVQTRTMESRTPPVKIIAPGRAFRSDAIDASHHCVFHQLEGLYVDTDVSFADLKGLLTAFARLYFGDSVKLRFRPSYFPFTEPSAEVDISCFLCDANGCRVCKHTGWLEILGCGMVDPNVFESVNYDSEKYTGYAFGMGIERIAMLKHRISDIRLLYENDLRFLEQF